jgi:hypothetical protein
MRRANWDAVKPRIQCVQTHWIPGSIASGRGPAGGRPGSGSRPFALARRPHWDTRLTGIALELQSSRARIRTSVQRSKGACPASLDEPGWFESSLYWNQDLYDLRRTRRKFRACGRNRRVDAPRRPDQQDRRDVTGMIQSADASRIVRRRPGGGYGIHGPICRNSLGRPCLTYGFVGYGYVSVQALVPVSSSSRGAR